MGERREPGGMTLLEAFREIGPRSTDAVITDRRSDAAATLLIELRRISRDPNYGPDAISTVLFNLVRSGPRGVRTGDPDSDESVKAFLIVAYGNATRTMARTAARRRESDAPVDTLAIVARQDVE